MSFFKRIFAAVTAFFVLLGADISTLLNPVVPTPVEGREYTDGVLEVEPDVNMHVIVKPVDAGSSIYAPVKGEGGYRYGPTVFANADGSIDAWFATIGAAGEWDIFTYRHSPDGGKSWTPERVVLSPTPGSYDKYSVCDPGVVKFGGYYYIGYTSTIYADGGGVCNNIFVARSVNPDGPFEKWNGSGWGGDPMPIIWFDEDWHQWGAGEPSMIAMGDTLYVYYTWRSVDKNGAVVNETRLATADATKENWPATLAYKGTALRYADAGCDSADVKYVEDYGKFVAISTSNRFSERSSISIYESNDGLGFEKTCDLRTNISVGCHNSGIASRPNGHIRLADAHYIAYAYAPEGAGWGQWPTRLQRVEFSLSAQKFIESADVPCLDGSDTVYSKYVIPTLTGITTSPRVCRKRVGDGGFSPYIVSIFARNETGKVSKVFVKYSGYDKDILKVVGGRCYPKGVGETWVTAEYRGFTTRFRVCVLPGGTPIDSGSPVAIRPMFPCYSLSLSSLGMKQIRAVVDYADGRFDELSGTSEGVTYSGYDVSVISVNERGIITALNQGATAVTVTVGELSFTVPVTVGR